jgi:hypothetical protein
VIVQWCNLFPDEKLEMQDFKTLKSTCRVVDTGQIQKLAQLEPVADLGHKYATETCSPLQF